MSSNDPTASSPVPVERPESTGAERYRATTTKLLAVAVAVGTLLVAAGVTMWAIIADPPGDTVGRSFLSLVLMAGFAYCVIGEASASERRQGWVSTGRIVGLVLIAGAGLYLTWHQVDPRPWADLSPDFGSFVVAVIMIEGVACSLLLVGTTWTRRMRLRASRVALAIGIALVGLCALAVAVPFVFWDSDAFGSTYWRVVLAIAVLAVVLLAIPLVIDAILAPKRPRAPQVSSPGLYVPPPGGYASPGHPGAPPGEAYQTPAPPYPQQIPYPPPPPPEGAQGPFEQRP